MEETNKIKKKKKEKKSESIAKVRRSSSFQ